MFVSSALLRLFDWTKTSKHASLDIKEIRKTLNKFKNNFILDMFEVFLWKDRQVKPNNNLRF